MANYAVTRSSNRSTALAETASGAQEQDFSSHIQTCADNGGVIIGAFEGERMVGAPPPPPRAYGNIGLLPQLEGN